MGSDDKSAKDKTAIFIAGLGAVANIVAGGPSPASNPIDYQNQGYDTGQSQVERSNELDAPTSNDTSSGSK